MPSPTSSPTTRTTPLPAFVRRALAEQAETAHPDWCTQTRCDGWFGRDHHLGEPQFFAGTDDVEFSLRRYQSGGDGAPAWMLTLRRLATVDTVEVVVSDDDLYKLLAARDRLLERELGLRDPAGAGNDTPPGGE